VTMDLQTLNRMQSDFQSVAQVIASGLAAFSPRVIALAAKWQRDDLVPGLSDLDFRLICADETSVEEWIEIDREIGRIHLKMVTEHPEWNRINEHTVGAAMRVSEVLDAPELQGHGHAPA